MDGTKQATHPLSSLALEQSSRLASGAAQKGQSQSDAFDSICRLSSLESRVAFDDADSDMMSELSVDDAAIEAAVAIALQVVSKSATAEHILMVRNIA